VIFPRTILRALLLISSFWLHLLASDDRGAQIRSLYERGEYADAVRLAENTAEPSSDVIFYHGLALARLERFDKAQAMFQSGRDRFPRDVRFPLELAGVAYRRKQIPQARSFLRKALQLEPVSDYGNEFLGSLYLLEGNPAAALKYWNRIDKPLIQEILLVPPAPVNPVLQHRAIVISGGQILTLERLRTTERSLNRLDIFAGQQIEINPRPDRRFDLKFRLVPISSPVTGGLARLLPIARGLPYQTVNLDRYNIGERAINFKSLWRWDSDKRRVALELAGPIALNPQRRYRLTFDARDENWDLSRSYPGAGLDRFKTRKIQAGADVVFALSKFDWTTGLRIARRRFKNHNGDPVFAGDWSFEQRNQFDYRLLFIPDRRLWVDSSAVVRTGRVLTGAPSRFAIFEGDVSGLWIPQATGNTWEFNARLRAGKTLGRIPFDEFFQLGMERDNELWLRGHAGTRDGLKGNAPLGVNYGLIQTGFDRTVAQFPFLQLRVGPFFDMGRITGPTSPFGSHGWLLDTGIQARVIVAGGLTWSVVYGRSLRDGGAVFYTAVSR
jgi:tetratricopeptide (TPR) repeat protein